MNTPKTNLTIMYSGGLDSFIAYRYALTMGFTPELLFVDLGHPYAEKEKQAIINLPDDIRPDVKFIDFSSLYPLIEDRLDNQIIPSRNVFLAVLGSMLNERVWVNALDGEQNGKEHDKSYKFFTDTTDLLSFTNSYFQERSTVETPFSHLTKAQTIKWALDNGVDKEILFSTTSCYNGNANKCGECLTCYKRKVAFMLNGIDEPGYDVNPFEQDYAKELEREIPLARQNNDFSRFTRKRVQEFFDLKEIMKDMGGK